MIKRLLTLFLVICLSIPLFSCGEKDLPNEISQEDWNSYRQYVELSTGITMSYVEMGDPNGEVIVLQHGMTDNSRSWSLTAPYFAEAGYHVYMPDLRGQGKSQETDGYYTTITYAKDLNAFFDAMEIDKAIVVGHSLGSYAVQCFWLMFPEKCSKIVLESSASQKGLLNTTLTYAYNYYIEPIEEDGHPSDLFMDNWYATNYQETKYSDIFDTFLTYMKQEAQALSKKSWKNVFMGMIASNIEDLYPLFDKSIPTLILHGNDDTMAKTEYQQELCDLLLDGSSDNYKNYTGVGHNIHFEIPETFATDVLYWLSTGTLLD